MKDSGQGSPEYYPASGRGDVETATLDELIDERLKLQEAKKLNVVASEEEVSKVIGSIAEKNKMTWSSNRTFISGNQATRGRRAHHCR